MSAIAVVGGGYVGLTTAACFARLGHDVVCGEVDREKVARLSKAEVPVLEEGRPALVAEGLAARRLSFVVGAANAADGRKTSGAATRATATAGAKRRRRSRK